MTSQDDTDQPGARAVVDRIVEGCATLLVGSSEREVTIPAGELPEGVGEGAWLLVREASGDLEILGVDTGGAAAHLEEAEDRLDRLRRGRGTGRFPPRT